MNVYQTLVREYPKSPKETWKEYKARLIEASVVPRDLKSNTLVKGYSRALASIGGREFINDSAEFHKQFEESFTRFEDGSAEKTFTVQADIRTEKEAIDASGIDVDVWDVVQCSIKHWTTPVKEKIVIRDDGVPVEVGVNFQGHKTITKTSGKLIQNSGITLKLAPRSNRWDEFRESILASVEPYDGPDIISPRTDSLALEMCIFDLHLGKVAFNPFDRVLNWSLPQAKEIYFDCVKTFIQQAKNLGKIDLVILPVGNDQFNIDNRRGTTTSGTNIGDGSIWDKLFAFGTKMVEEVAMMIVESYGIPVKIFGIPGNHDQQTVLSMMHVLDARFREYGEIEVVNNGQLRQHMIWGSNFIGWHHGDRVKPNMLKEAFAADCDSLASLPFKYVHLGHVHHAGRKEIMPRDTMEEVGGIEFEYIPSLCPTDQWHNDMLFVGNMRRAKSFIYDFYSGLIQSNIYNLHKDGKYTR